MIGFGVSLALPSEPIGFLGLLPILLGVWKLLEVVFPTEEEEEAGKSRIAGMKSIFKVSVITVMNAADGDAEKLRRLLENGIQHSPRGLFESTPLLQAAQVSTPFCPLGIRSGKWPSGTDHPGQIAT